MLYYFKQPSLFWKFFWNLSPLFCHFVAYNIEYYEWLCRLRRHIQVSSFPVQGTWLALLVAQSVIWGSLWPTAQTSNNSVINSGPSMTMKRLNSLTESHIVSLAKIYHLSTKSFLLVCVHWNSVDSIF